MTAVLVQHIRNEDIVGAAQLGFVAMPEGADDDDDDDVAQDLSAMTVGATPPAECDARRADGA